MSLLHLTEAAHMTARAAWLQPHDRKQRAYAVEACRAVGVDYCRAVRAYRDMTGADVSRARREVAEALRAAADNLYEEEAV